MKFKDIVNLGQPVKNPQLIEKREKAKLVVDGFTKLLSENGMNGYDAVMICEELVKKFKIESLLSYDFTRENQGKPEEPKP